MTTPADDPLLSIASSISDRTDVDWQHSQNEDTDASVSAVLAELRLVERIAQLHGSPAWDVLQIVEPVGHGRRSSVYRAYDPDLRREVALKITRSDDPERTLVRARRRERVSHPHLVAVLRAERRDREVGIWMEFVDGRTLDAIVQAQGPFGAREAAAIGADLCQALAALHGAGLVHGKVAARNVMRDASGRVVLMDRDGAPAPAADAAADLHALGLLLSQLTAGGADLPAPFAEVVRRASSDDPAQRFESAAAFGAALLDTRGRTLLSTLAARIRGRAH